MNTLFYIFVLFSIISEVTAQYLFKLIHKNLKNLENYKKNLYLTLGIILYALTGFCAYKLLEFTNLLVANIIWHIFHFILLFLVGYIFLNERLTKNQILGSIFGIISIIIFMLNDDKNHIH